MINYNREILLLKITEKSLMVMILLGVLLIIIRD